MNYIELSLPFNKHQLLKCWIHKKRNLQQDFALYPESKEIGNKNVILVDLKYCREYYDSVREISQTRLQDQAPQIYSHFVMNYVKALAQKRLFNFTIIEHQRDQQYFQEKQDHRTSKLCMDPIHQILNKESSYETEYFLEKQKQLEWSKNYPDKKVWIRKRKKMYKIIFSKLQAMAVKKFFMQELFKKFKVQQVQLDQFRLYEVPDIDILEIQELLGIKIIRKQEHYIGVVPSFTQEVVEIKSLKQLLRKILDSRNQDILPNHWPILSMKRSKQLIRQIEIQAPSFLKLLNLQELPPNIIASQPFKVFNFPHCYNIQRSLILNQNCKTTQFYLICPDERISGISSSQSICIQYPQKSAPLLTMKPQFIATESIRIVSKIVSSLPFAFVFVCRGCSYPGDIKGSRIVIMQSREQEYKKYEGRIEVEEGTQWTIKDTNFIVDGRGKFKRDK